MTVRRAGWVIALAAGCSGRAEQGSAPPPPALQPLTCYGDPMQIVFWGDFSAIRFDTCASGDDLLAGSADAACAEAWTDLPRAFADGLAGDWVCQAASDLKPDAWCAANLPCWTGTSCPLFGEFVSLINLRDPALAASVRSCSWRGDGYVTVTLPLPDGVERVFLFAVPPGGAPEDAAMVTTELVAPPSWIDGQ